jgi:AraC-like DNA-binding protein
MRYVAFDRNDPEGLKPILNGADVITVSDDLIMTVSDFYCDPNPVDLMEIAKLTEGQHGQLNIGPLGLNAQTSGRIKRRLAELAADMTVFLNPTLTVTQLSDHVGCSVMHLFHVLEEEKETTFLDFVNECRARYASTLLLDKSNIDIRFDRIAEQSSFETIAKFREEFQSTFDISPDDYLQKFRQ